MTVAVSPRIEVDAGSVSELPAGTMRRCVVEGTTAGNICVAHVGPLLFAVDDKCPDRGGRLSLGLLDGNVVECPVHGWRFNLQNGRRADGPERIRCYPVEVREGRILVRLRRARQPFVRRVRRLVRELLKAA
jgi:nitrite reductase/ring-hydroxylating ferredoxin subunit